VPDHFYTPPHCAGCGNRGRLEPFEVHNNAGEAMVIWLDLRCSALIKHNGPREGITIEHAAQYHILK
jgi:pyruvate/2-oxoacid:ferredoxin oxidoreductase beta subunit